jgi:hypothetical protein
MHHDPVNRAVSVEILVASGSDPAERNFLSHAFQRGHQLVPTVFGVMLEEFKGSHARKCNKSSKESALSQ